MKKTLSAILALILAGSTLLGMVACGETADDLSVVTSAATTVEAETEQELAYNTVEKQQFDRDFVIYVREDGARQFVADSYTGVLFSDLIYERNITVEKDFDITFKHPLASADTINSDIRLQVSGGLTDYDLYDTNLFSFSSCAHSGYCYNLADIDTIDLTAAWWDQACIENLSIDGKTYIATGDLHPASKLTTSCMVVNKKVLINQQKKVDDLYDLVTDGGWTLDVMYEYCDGLTMDLNGDDIIDYDHDFYGYTSWYMDSTFSMFYGAGGRFVTIVDGLPELAYSVENVLDIYDKLYAIMIEQKAFLCTDVALHADTYQIFTEGRALFCDATLNKLSTMEITQMSDPYGILPIPKYDTNQPEYLGFVNGSSVMGMVASNNKDVDFVGTILEAMATFDYDKVTPNLFEVSTKLQAAQDPASAAMVDYIVRNRIYDLAYFGEFGLTEMIRDGLADKKESIASILKTNTNIASKKLKQIVNKYAKHQ